MGDGNAGAITQDSHTDVLAFTAGSATSNTEASPLFLGLPVVEGKASAHGIGAASGVCHDVRKWYCQTGTLFIVTERDF